MQKSITKLYSAKQTREIDQRAQKELEITGFELMLKAAQACLDSIKEHYSAIENLAVVCGAGNNAGDGYLVAKLAMQAGYRIQLISVINPNRLSADAKLAKEHFIQAGGEISSNLDLVNEPYDLIVDAILGTGINRNIDDNFLTAINLINQHSAPVFSIDIPSGLNAETGNIMGAAIHASYCLSFIVHKQGMHTGLAADYIGTLLFADLGVLPEIIEQTDSESHLITKLTLAKRHKSAHKGHFGHSLIVGGDYQYAGAVQLAAQAALNSGSGLVSVATRAQHAQNIHISCPELMGLAIEDPDDIKQALSNFNALVIGPGLGQNEWGSCLFNALVNSEIPKVLDADALNLLAKNPAYSDNWILTPHPGEAARLLNTTTHAILKDRFQAVKNLQNKYGGICILKGAGTLIYDGNRISVNSTGNPGMASGGMGDVLAGLIGGLVAQKYSLHAAAIAGVFLHGLAADIVAKQTGERGLRASQVINNIQQVVN